MLLVRNRQDSKIKLIIISIDPWKELDFSKKFDVPENVFVVKNSNIFLPRSIDGPLGKQPLNYYTSDKIRSVHIIPQDGSKEKYATLLI